MSQASGSNFFSGLVFRAGQAGDAFSGRMLGLASRSLSWLPILLRADSLGPGHSFHMYYVPSRCQALCWDRGVRNDQNTAPPVEVQERWSTLSSCDHTNQCINTHRGCCQAGSQGAGRAEAGSEVWGLEAPPCLSWAVQTRKRFSHSRGPLH